MQENRNLPMAIIAEGIKKGYPLPGGDTFWALKGVDLEIPQGKLTILRGRSGSGKTTLMNILGALDVPTEGSVIFHTEEEKTIALQEISEAERTSLRRTAIGYVFQSVALIPMMTARENVEFALRMGHYTGDRVQRVRECLELVGLSARAEHMPAQLSGGEQQRVAIARAIAHRPSIVFADEPTGELDTQTAVSVVGLFRQLCQTQGVTIVMTTHDRGFMDIGDQIYQLEDGEIIHGYWTKGKSHDRV